MLTHDRIIQHTHDMERDNVLQMIIDAIGLTDLDCEMTSLYKLKGHWWMSLLHVNLNPNTPPRLAEVVSHLDSLFVKDVDIYSANYQGRLHVLIQLSIVPTGGIPARGSDD